MYLFVVFISLLLSSVPAQSRTIQDLIENVSGHTGLELDRPLIKFGDIAVASGLQNADQCTARGCKWDRSSDGKVYVPYVISNQYSPNELQVIKRAMKSFAEVSCIRFIPHQGERNYLQIQSNSGCFSYLGRQREGQVVSLQRQGCVYHQIVQHELLHALGFHHEQNRSDRDKHIQVLYQNIIPAMQYNFNKVETNNLGTPYDYNSVMHYSRFAFSKNNMETMIPIPDRNAVIGEARQMSPNDILRINRLYCS